MANNSRCKGGPVEGQHSCSDGRPTTTPTTR
jgi:hypothetical protein